MACLVPRALVAVHEGHAGGQASVVARHNVRKKRRRLVADVGVQAARGVVRDEPRGGGIQAWSLGTHHQLLWCAERSAQPGYFLVAQRRHHLARRQRARRCARGGHQRRGGHQHGATAQGCNSATAPHAPPRPPVAQRTLGLARDAEEHLSRLHAGGEARPSQRHRPAPVRAQLTRTTVRACARKRGWRRAQRCCEDPPRRGVAVHVTAQVTAQRTLPSRCVLSVLLHSSTSDLRRGGVARPQRAVRRAQPLCCGTVRGCTTTRFTQRRSAAQPAARGRMKVCDHERGRADCENQVRIASM